MLRRTELQARRILLFSDLRPDLLYGRIRMYSKYGAL